MLVRQRLFVALAFAVAPFVSAHAAANAAPDYVAQAVTDPGRPPGDIARDGGRKPADVLGFSNIKPGQVVVDWMPGDGYYTRMLAKLVGAKGKVYPMVLHFGATGDARKPENHVGVDQMLMIQNVAEYSRNVVVLWQMPWQDGGQFSVPEQVDAVLTSRNYHALHGKAANKLDVVAVTKEMFRSLKPGGYYVVSDHSAAKGTGFSKADDLGRVDADAVKAEILSAGFVLDGESNALAASDDDHTKPAAVMQGKEDTFLLRFRKPLNASGETKRPKTDVMTGFYGNTSISGGGSPTERHVFYHPDGTYQEFGAHDMQAGLWYWDAAGHNCMIHQFPVEQRQFIVCHSTASNKKVGDHWTQDNGSGQNEPERPYFFLPAIGRALPLRVRALVWVRWPRTGRPLR